MKTIFIIIFSVFFTLNYIQAQPEVTGLPGDHFDLQGALEMFKQSDSPEDFEKRINKEDNHVNNLDLNEDGKIDYIQVIDKVDGDDHALVLQVAVSATEIQDIAVIEIEKNGKESALLQIIGDEDIYGEAVIFEPASDEESDKKSKNNKGPFFNSEDDAAVVINVWYWPSVSFVYGPVYRPWVSPFRWGFYPNWWNPWRPLAWSSFHPFRARYRSAFVIAPFHRTVRVHKVYTPHRVTSVTVQTRHRSAVNNYRVTRKTTTVHATNGNKTVHANKKTTTVKGQRGSVTRTKTNATVKKKRN